MLDLYQSYRHRQLLYRLLSYGGVGSLLLILLVFIHHMTQRQQQVQLRSHWQQALKAAQQAQRTTTLLSTPRTRIDDGLTLRQRMQILFAAFPSAIGFTQLQLEPTRVVLEGYATDSPPLLSYCQRLVASYPNLTRHQLMWQTTQQFRLELHTSAHAPSNSTWQSARVAATYYQWLTQAETQHRWQLLSSRLATPHSLRLRVSTSYAQVSPLLQQLERLLGPRACVSLTLQTSPDAAGLQVTVLCH